MQTNQEVKQLADKIAAQLQGLVDHAVCESNREPNLWKEKYMGLLFDLNDVFSEAQHLYDGMKIEGLTVGAIEAEGYLRCAKMLYNRYAEEMAEHGLIGGVTSE